MGFFKVKNKRSLLSLLIIIVFTESALILSAYLAIFKINTYSNLVKPVFAPPMWVYAVIWPFVYLVMGYAAYRIWMLRKQEKYIGRAVRLYFIQLFLNFIWLIIFLRFRLVGLAFLMLMLAIVFVMLTTFEFFRLDKLAGLVMIPFIAWLCYAGVLNFSFWMLNNM
ncbi:TspO/MBR family protein [Candidatus Clostridium radicumherbarum]|uniref:TspO/MBR family protein n=1 Tax=Candidatus Clostridium radicumherbarum TaxID=3381662 RepID=A0ABW8TNM5_9CLOT